MKKIIAIICICLLFIQCKNNIYETNSEIKVQQHIVNNLNKLSKELQNLENLVTTNTSSKTLQNQFLKCRLIYKNTEWATEYYLPQSSKFLNGPALDHLDLDENKFLEAQGFQVLEELLYPEFDIKQKTEIIKQIRIIDNLVRAGKTNITAINPTKEQIFDALRLGVFKITTLGITGFDTPVSNLLFPESQAALKGIEEVLEIYKTEFKGINSYLTVIKLTKNAQKSISKNTDKNNFNYLAYIVNYLDPISKNLHKLQVKANIPFVKRVSMLKSNASSLFSENVFDVNAVAVDENVNEAKTKLGEKLFYDKNLSKNNSRSCASCHKPEKAFTDGLKVATNLQGKPMVRNTPSLNYAGFYHGQFWDMRQSNIESLTTTVIQNKDEMHGNMSQIIKIIQKNSLYAKKLKEIYKTNEIKEWHIQNALASYVRSLSTFSSKFDQYMRGNKNALSKLETKGFNVFVGKAKCATCHFIPLFNGTVPPRFSSSEQEVLGVPKDINITKLDTDLGRYLYNTDLQQLKNSFKTVSIRNIEKTAPYMHNGVFETLEQVIDFYDKGGGLGFKLPVTNQTLPQDKLNLTKLEQSALIAFIKTLNDQY
ncbi:cytochrome c peroxidase [Myroides sp. JBRI-B21084]|uniref:cytochrome-c peroxidase n=1 Tax=Myroides sp. JBRI-B21084 TaxID=3119977 RepID=UPI0026E38A53|nr:cytochrome c peroxidase [Paenimyroides cloacae]WKW46851.1 cytochrome c peroxidase [Paenimyroides cloacae]